MHIVNRLDLNLLRLFDAVMRHGHVSRAAHELDLTQPAASQGLMRLRRELGDPLFERTGSGVRPTPRALRLAEPVRSALGLLQSALQEAAPAFDPARSQRVFQIHMSDIGESRFLPELMKQVCRLAPGVRVATRPLPHAELGAALDEGRIDCAFGFLPALKGPTMRRCELTRDRYGILLRRDHPFLQGGGAGRRPSPAALRALEFVAVRTHTETLRILQWLRLEDRLRLTTEHFMVLPTIVQATDLAVLMPRAIAQTFMPQHILLEPELPEAEFVVSLHWSTRRESDPGNQWLRQVAIACFGGGAGTGPA